MLQVGDGFVKVRFNRQEEALSGNVAFEVVKYYVKMEANSYSSKRKEIVILCNNLHYFLGKNIRVTFIDNTVLEGYCNTFTGKLDTEDELYDEITIKTDKHPYVGFNESEIKSIEII